VFFFVETIITSKSKIVQPQKPKPVLVDSGMQTDVEEIPVIVSGGNAIIKQVKECFSDTRDKDALSSAIKSMGLVANTDEVKHDNVHLHPRASFVLRDENELRMCMNGYSCVPRLVDVPVISVDRLESTAALKGQFFRTAEELRAYVETVLREQGRLDSSVPVPVWLDIEHKDEQRNQQIQDIIESELLFTIFTCLSAFGSSLKSSKKKRAAFDKTTAAVVDYLYCVKNKLLFRDARAKDFVLMGLESLYESKVEERVLAATKELVHSDSELASKVEDVKKSQREAKNVCENMKNLLTSAMSKTESRSVFMYLGMMLVYVMMISNAQLKDAEDRKVYYGTENAATELRGHAVMKDIKFLWSEVKDSNGNTVTMRLKQTKKSLLTNVYFQERVNSEVQGKFEKQVLLYRMPDTTFVRWSDRVMLQVALSKARFMCSVLADADPYKKLLQDDVCANMYGKWLAHMTPLLGSRVMTDTKHLNKADGVSLVFAVLTGQTKKTNTSSEPWKCELFRWFSLYHQMALTSFFEPERLVFSKRAHVRELEQNGDKGKTEDVVEKEQEEEEEDGDSEKAKGDRAYRLYDRVVHSPHRVFRLSMFESVCLKTRFVYELGHPLQADVNPKHKLLQDIVETLPQCTAKSATFASLSVAMKRRIDACLNAFVEDEKMLTKVKKKVEKVFEDELVLYSIMITDELKQTSESADKYLNLANGLKHYDALVYESGFLQEMCRVLAEDVCLGTVDIFNFLVLAVGNVYTFKDDNGVKSLHRGVIAHCMKDLLGISQQALTVAEVRTLPRCAKGSNDAKRSHFLQGVLLRKSPMLCAIHAICEFLRANAIKVEEQIRMQQLVAVDAFAKFFASPSDMRCYDNAAKLYADLQLDKKQSWRLPLYLEYEWHVKRYNTTVLHQRAFSSLHVDTRKSVCMEQNAKRCVANVARALQVRHSGSARNWSSTDMLVLAEIEEVLMRHSKRLQQPAAAVESQWSSLVGFNTDNKNNNNNNNNQDCALLDMKDCLLSSTEMNNLVECLSKARRVEDYAFGVYSFVKTASSLQYLNSQLFHSGKQGDVPTANQKYNIRQLCMHVRDNSICTYADKVAILESVLEDLS